MSLDRHPRSGRRGTIRIHAIVAFSALVALLVARNIPPDFHQAVSLQYSSVASVFSISAVSSHDQRPRFDCNGSQWSAPAASFLPFPPAAVSVHSACTSHLFPNRNTKGFHYNRPPPVV
jgi:hypothetical protein